MWVGGCPVGKFMRLSSDRARFAREQKKAPWRGLVSGMTEPDAKGVMYRPGELQTGASPNPLRHMRAPDCERAE